MLNNHKLNTNSTERHRITSIGYPHLVGQRDYNPATTLCIYLINSLLLQFEFEHHERDYYQNPATVKFNLCENQAGNLLDLIEHPKRNRVKNSFF